jgi:hypothetical protein
MRDDAAGDGLVEFLRARLVEREQALRVLAEARLTEDELPELARGPMLLIQAGPDGREQQALRELFADIEVKRQIIAMHDHVPASESVRMYPERGEEPFGCRICADHDGLIWPVGWCETLRLLGLPYAEDGGYRAAWVPDAEVGHG